MSKNVLITGANRGVGLALVRKFLKSGYDVIAASRNSSDGLKQLATEYPENLTELTLDVADFTSVREAAETLKSRIESIDYLINNAGIYGQDYEGKIDKLDLDDGQLQEIMNVNAFGPLRVTQQFLPLLRKGKTRTIVNISSEAGSVSQCWREGVYAYCMSKAALNMETRILDLHLRKEGFTVLAVHPGWVRSDMGGSGADISTDESAEGIYEQVMKPRSEEDPIYFDYTGKTWQW